MLLDAFPDPQVGAAYGRQLPHHNASPFGRHSASFLYPATSDVRTLANAPRHGIRTAPISNSFAAYRIRALNECGGFPSTLILGEDTHVGLRMLLMRHLVEENEGIYIARAQELPLLRYYANSVAHLLN